VHVLEKLATLTQQIRDQRDGDDEPRGGGGSV